MLKNQLDETFEIIDSELKKSSITRRDAIKLATITSAGLFTGTTELNAGMTKNIEVKGKILIIGGGLAGISTAARLSSSLKNPDITIIEPNPNSVSYQSGNTLVAAGIYDKSDIIYNTKEFVPKNTKLIKDKAVEFNPESNKVVLSSGEVLTYDFLVIAAGLKLNFGEIKGLEELEETYSIANAKRIKDKFKDAGLCSIYNTDLAEQTWVQLQNFIKRASHGEKVKAIFTHPNTKIKCGGAPKKIMYLAHSRLKEAKAHNNAELSFFTSSSKMFPVKEYHDVILQQFKEKGFKWNYKHNLTGIDIENKIATFEKSWKEKGEFDEDLEKHLIVEKHEDVNVSFDLLHITPPMKVADEIGKSAIGSSDGYIPVDKETLQHIKYKNIFALGDVAGVPLGKTGGSIRKQYKVLTDNLIALMQGKEMPSAYDGYTVCPLITDIGKVMLAEFNWTMKPTATFPLDPTKERYLWWLIKVYLLKPLTIHGMLKGIA